jgi:ABC-type uncharacterized transport system substrate-binding protein
LPALAAELVRREVNVIAVAKLRCGHAADNATKLIPIVFSVTVDPVTPGLVVSLA